MCAMLQSDLHLKEELSPRHDSNDPAGIRFPRLEILRVDSFGSFCALELLPQALPRYSQDLRGLCPLSVGLLQRLLDEVLLKAVHRLRERRAFHTLRGLPLVIERQLSCDVLGPVARLDGAPRRDNPGMLYRMAKFPHISWKVVPEKGGPSLRRELLLLSLVLKFSKEESAQARDITAPIAEGRDPQVQNLETVVEVLSESTARNQ